MKSLDLYKRAIYYRKTGYSYNMIKQKLGLAKSTLSNWFKDIPYHPNKKTISRIKTGRIKTINTRRNQKIANIAEAKKLAQKDLGELTKRDLFLLGIGLYWGEGDKASSEGVKIMNSDPEVIKIMIKWFKTTCGLTTKNFKLTVYTYPDNDIPATINYWSKITNIPKEQFGKTQIDRRTNKSQRKIGKLPFGTVKLAVRSQGKKELGVFLHRRIMGWIEFSSKLINAGIV